jgi:hypothetical protein
MIQQRFAMRDKLLQRERKLLQSGMRQSLSARSNDANPLQNLWKMTGRFRAVLLRGCYTVGL